MFLNAITHALGSEFGLEVLGPFMWRAFVGACNLCNFWEEEVISS
jgi:hypothetical protein